MNILLASHLFAPSVGGVERVGGLLARSFQELGHAVRVVTRTRAPVGPSVPTHNPAATDRANRRFAIPHFGHATAPAAPPSTTGRALVPGRLDVQRCPNPVALLRAVRWCDVYLQNNISLQTAWPLLFTRRPWVIVHHTWLARSDGRRGWQDHLKRWVARFGSSIAVSRAVAQALPVASVVLPNPYDDELFRELPETERDQDLICVGRLVSDKGVDVLLRALGQLRSHGLAPRLTVVGEGPESAALKQLAGERGIQSQIQFVGCRTGGELVQLLNQHRILVAPSRWREPFGLVALEGIACGCVAVGSAGGGLPEAIGPCGVTFPNGNSERLAEALADLLRHPDQVRRYRTAARAHLELHQRRRVAQAYLSVLANARAGRANPFELRDRPRRPSWSKAA